MAYTISTHNGSSVSRQHNLRNRKITDKEDHIDPKGIYEIWHDEDPAEAYQRIFGAAVKDYNSRQDHPERRIYNYYQHVSKSAKQHPIYEMIASVGRVDHAPDPELGKQILKEFADGWKAANPNLEMIGCYYHADEQGIPHIHIDYVPVAHGYKKGLHTQAGLVKALGEMGFEKHGKETAQIQWQRSENSRLENICRSHGLEIEHPLEKHRQHLDTRQYKAEKKVEKMEDRADRAQQRARKHEIRAIRLEEQAAQLGIDNSSYNNLKSNYEALRAFCARYTIKDKNGKLIKLIDAYDREQKEARECEKREISKQQRDLQKKYQEHSVDR